MTETRSLGRLEERLAALVDERNEASERFFALESDRIARLCHRMAERFARGARLLAVGATGQGRSDARHVAVEFVHPVVVGKRALAAMGITREGGSLPSQLALVAEAEDMVIACDGAEETTEAIGEARRRGCLTIAFESMGAEWELEPPTEDPFVRQELSETVYHVLWELVHVFFDHRGLLAGRQAGSLHDAGGSSFLYPFLAEQDRDLEGVVADVRASVLMKAQETADLRAQTVSDAAAELVSGAGLLRSVFDSGGTVLALGNGGSATDAMDAVADFRAAPQGFPHRRALDLTEDSAILTALANDIGPDVLFARQIIAYGRVGDVVLALSTSGNSANIMEALGEARRRGLHTIAMVGYDGGRVAEEQLADHVVVARSEHIPRIQEAHATAYHALRELVELTGEGLP